MKPPVDLQPDQQPARWDNHVSAYETVFEPLTDIVTRRTLDRIDLRPGCRLIDIGAGSGGAALIAAGRGAHVLAVDASHGMVERIRQRAQHAPDGRAIRAAVMDGAALALPDNAFDVALSVFGVILFPDVQRGMRELVRVLQPGGRAAVVTWTETEKYELAARMIEAIAAVRGPQPPPASLPAQLRFRDPAVFRDLLGEAGLQIEEIVRIEETWRLPSAQWLAERIAFAPGMAAMIGGLGADRAAVLDAFINALEHDQGTGEIALTAVAQAGIGTKPPAKTE